MGRTSWVRTSPAPPLNSKASRYQDVHPRTAPLLGDGAVDCWSRPADRCRSSWARGGGSTRLRVYAAWVAEFDRKAAELLRSRLPVRKALRSEAMYASRKITHLLRLSAQG